MIRGARRFCKVAEQIREFANFLGNLRGRSRHGPPSRGPPDGLHHRLQSISIDYFRDYTDYTSPPSPITPARHLSEPCCILRTSRAVQSRPLFIIPEQGSLPNRTSNRTFHAARLMSVRLPCCALFRLLRCGVARLRCAVTGHRHDRTFVDCIEKNFRRDRRVPSSTCAVQGSPPVSRRANVRNA